jgi:hypothetical protein
MIILFAPWRMISYSLEDFVKRLLKAAGHNPETTGGLAA